MTTPIAMVRTPVFEELDSDELEIIARIPADIDGL